MLNTHEAVELAQIIGVPDRRYAEVPAAFVKLTSDRKASEKELIAYCEKKLARFKIPRYVRFVEDWPMSTSKIQKFKLKEQFVAELESQAKPQDQKEAQGQTETQSKHKQRA
ncbi:MAG: hypothetical protein OXT03_00505 [Alphaproteobacteria bacterium]|nr:hypothetical protein [Alphaproteobacteria bacterium]